MTTIVEPKEHIDKLWGKQQIKPNQHYRLMRYVLRVDHDGKILLLNVVTGKLVILSDHEAGTLDRLPTLYNESLRNLVEDHYLVPEDYDEHQQVLNLRNVFQKLGSTRESIPTAITDYTILPTTACNARCYYCFEQGVPVHTMTEQIADDTVRFIADHCGSKKKVSVRWFGGEPTVASHRIDQICRGLQAKDISYSSSMTTNGYLFDEEMVCRAKALWHLKDVMICIDGTETHYNEIKAYVNAQDNPYQRVLRNIGILLDHGVRVSLRMNFDVNNYQDFKDVISEAIVRFHRNKLLTVYAFPIRGEYPDKNGEVHHATKEWFDKKLSELNDLAQDAGLFQRKKELPSLFLSRCSAGSPWCMDVTATGKLGRCTGIFFDESQIVGNVKDGLTVSRFCEPWLQYADPKQCRSCTFFPSCILIEKCPEEDRCFLTETYRQYIDSVKDVYNHYQNSVINMKGGNAT